MTWPSSDVNTTGMDAGTDTPPRAEFLSWAQKFNQLRNHVSAFMQGLLTSADAAAARTTLDVPTRTGGNASGTWGISISGSASNADRLNGIDSSGFTRTTGISSLGSFAQTSGNSSGGFSGIVEATNAASGFGTATAFDARLHGVLVGGVHFTDMGDGGCEVSLDYTPPGDPNTDRRFFGGLRLRTDGIVEAKGFLSNAGVGAIGTYALLKEDNATNRLPGDTLSGSSLFYSNASGAVPSAINPAGTWRCMGFKWGGGAPNDRVTTWLRIA